jgi:hypothetical protein
VLLARLLETIGLAFLAGRRRGGRTARGAGEPDDAGAANGRRWRISARTGGSVDVEIGSDRCNRQTDRQRCWARMRGVSTRRVGGRSRRSSPENQ